jgi:D-inositol-3-phosphate glycosyltransferase
MGKLTQYCHLDEFVTNLRQYTESHNLHYNLLHSHYWLSGEAGRRLGRLWNVPNIIMFHTIGIIKNNLGIGTVETELRLAIEQGLTANSQRIIAATEREKSDLITHYKAVVEKISVIPCGVNLDLFNICEYSSARRQLGLNGDKVALYVGRIEPLKGIDKFLEAMAHIDDSLEKRALLIGGDSYSEAELEKLKEHSRSLGIEDKVSFLGSVEQQKLPLYYSAADVCVVPSYYETFGLVALESLACGTPVVATDVGGLKSIIRDGKTGYVVTDNNPMRLAEKIGNLLNYGETKIAGATAIRESVLQFSWHNIAAAVAKEYGAVLKISR